MIRKNKRYNIYYMLPGNEKLGIWTFAGWDVGFDNIMHLLVDYCGYNNQKVFPYAYTRDEADKTFNVLLQCRTIEDIMEIFPNVKITEEDYLI